MSIGISIAFRPYQIPKGEPITACLDVARAIDDAGFHSIIFGDHLLLSSHTEKYPYGPWVHPQESAWPEPLTTLAAMAAVTKSIKLATGILLSPLRQPVLLAKTIATLDALSEGRTQLALGLGWQREEYDAVGVPWDERYRRFDEGVEVCRALWGEQPVTFSSENVKLDEVWALPRPAQARVPLLYGVAMTPKNAARIARLGDGWCPVAVPPSGIREGVDLFAGALSAVGRDIKDQHIRIGLPLERNANGSLDLGKMLAHANEFVEAGATIITISVPQEPQTMREIFDFIKDAAQAVDKLK